MNATRRLVPLQGLRAIAALSIAWAHLHHVFARQPGGPDFGMLAYAVDVFFVISGFIMMHREWDSFGEPESVRKFFVRRLARIVPLYWGVSLIYLYFVLRVPGLTVANLSWDVVWKSFLFIPAVRPQGNIHPLIDIGWTLNYEMLFYMTFGLALFLPRWIGLGALGLGYLALYNSPAWLPSSTAIEFWANIRLFEFFFGIGIAVAFRYRERLPGWLCAASILSGVALWQLIVSGPPIPFLTGYTNVMAYFASAALIVAGAVFYQGPLPRPLASTFNTLGDASYAIYLMHPLTYYYTLPFFGINVSTQSWAYMLFALSAVIIGAVLVHRYFEAPAARWLAHAAETSGKSFKSPAADAARGATP
ncbi:MULTISPECIES: acyltransferase [unclassified Bradyrhizobium]|uniref:acyltransferase family protein n=1 Tax=unclassified Bradyrhizobium TaxID=2631580 RepID=UPI0028E5AFF6|nr:MULTISPECIES: acyltransferase [unclassified Bradyrhizobium]